MYYKTKIIDSGNHVEIYEYDEPIWRADGSNKTLHDLLPSEKPKRKPRRSFDELNPDEQRERLNRMEKTRKDARAELIRLIDCNFIENKTSFLTLTIKENVTNRDEFTKIFDKFISKFNYNFLGTKKRKLKYVAALEQQERGAWHAHILLFDVPFIQIRKLREVWGHGAIKINCLKKLDDTSNVGLYVSKYMVKAMGQQLLEYRGKKSYLSSHNLKKL